MKQNVGKAVKIAVLTVGAFVMIFPFCGCSLPP